MNLRQSILFILCTLPLWAFWACEKLDIPSDENNPHSKETDIDSLFSSDSTGFFSYSVNDIISEKYDTEKDVYIVGYIVGYISGNNIQSSEFSTGDIKTNIILADIPVEKNYNNCIPIQLSTATTACNETRQRLNLSDNPTMLGKKIRLQGDIETYMDTKGIKGAKNHNILEDDFDYEAYYASLNHTDETPTMTDTLNYVNSHGIEESVAFSVHDFKTYIPTYLNYYEASGIKDCYVEGYIVGYIKKQGHSMANTIFSTGDVETNIVIADSPTESDPMNCIAIQLTQDSSKSQSTREALNLSSHPENLHRKVIIFGNIETYMSTLGLKNARQYLFTN